MTERGHIVLQIARGAITEALGAGRLPSPPDSAWLRAPGASFVTLRRDGGLRGCIGSLEAYRPLAQDIAANAVAAAIHDRRFPPVAGAELARIDIEVSLLTPAEPLTCEDENDACQKLRRGVDGVVIEYGARRATFLPQVWENLPDAADFLSELKMKAGLPADFWHADMRVLRYGVEKHSERNAR